jgi:type II secretory pathway pseudopilin PulG
VAVRALLADESGVTIVELLVVIVLVGVIMSATLTTFTQFEQTTAANQRQNDAQDQVRVGLDGVARELRNLASPTDELPQAVVRATATDLVFQSVSSTTTRRVRYCYDATAKRVWRQVQLPTFTMPATQCPDSSWGTERAAVENVVNGERAVFAYNATELTAITEIGTTLWVDVDTVAKPAETSLQTSVFLRNQNRSPTAQFTVAVNGGTIVLNGSESSDPEGKALEYYWYDADVEVNECTPAPPAELPQTGCIGVGIVLNYTPPAPGTRDLNLVVRDPATLTDEASSQTVCVPGTGVTC